MGYSWQFALTAVLIEGILFVLLCMSNMRKIIFDMVPISLKYAIAAGIGFFIAMIGMKNSGILATGTIFNHINTLTSPSSLLFLLGLVLTGTFATMRLRGGLLLSIIIVTLAGIPLGVTSLPDTLFSLPETPAPLFCQFSWADLLTPDLWVCVLTMLFSTSSTASAPPLASWLPQAVSVRTDASPTCNASCSAMRSAPCAELVWAPAP
jgi:AGZA family xanthine/uracil permease-like MFS transporter